MAQSGISGPADVFSFGASAKETDKITINDAHFIGDLTRLKELRSFLIQEVANISLDDSTALSFGKLNLLKYGADGREPTLEEWSDVELHTRILFHLLTEPLRRRFVLGEIPSWVAIKLPIVLPLVALAALIMSVVAQDLGWFMVTNELGSSLLPFYSIWLMALGACGSVAFIGMNALSVQQDITFDLNNRRLMILRIALGALFGLVLTLPFGFESFKEFINAFGASDLPRKFSVSQQAILLLLPFVLGFSTSLVIMILNRLVDGIQTFFGKSGTGESIEAPSAGSQPSSFKKVLSR